MSTDSREPLRCRAVGGVLVALVAGSCARGDVSKYLESGRCDDEGRCAHGYQCEPDTWQCLRDGSHRDAGGSEEEADAQPDAAPPLQPDAQLPAHADALPAQSDVQPRCDEGLTRCGAQCVDLERSSAHCGSCGATCMSGTVDLACGNFATGTCDCAGDDARCGAEGESRCEPATGLCVCGGSTCARGEVCRAGASGKLTCTCDGVMTCGQGMTCCLGYGCTDLTTRPDHCGICGNACPASHYCQDGGCRCRNAKSCDAGAAGSCTAQGRCQCDGLLCQPGQRCVGRGVCG